MSSYEGWMQLALETAALAPAYGDVPVGAVATPTGGLLRLPG